MAEHDVTLRNGQVVIRVIIFYTRTCQGDGRVCRNVARDFTFCGCIMLTRVKRHETIIKYKENL